MVKTIGIVSLSSGIIGEAFAKHEVDLGIKRLNRYGIKVKFMNHALKGIDFLQKHPEKRAEDLIQAFQDPEIDMILCAIGGDDTYRLLPYLFEHDQLKNAVCKKIFLGFSDSTMNHFMFRKVGLNTFYGQSFLPDVCELSEEMLPYSKRYFEELITTGHIKEICCSDVWYEGRTDFDEGQMGVPLTEHPNRGYELLQGKPVFSGKIYGGCIDTIFDIFNGERYADSPELCGKYELFPSAQEWKGNILLLETSEEQMSPEKYKRALTILKNIGVFDAVNGVIVGKPIDEIYYEEYKRILVETIDNPELPIAYNISVGHALPRCIIPFGVDATVDLEQQKIVFADKTE
ncbi:MAG: S66 family peptidase [Massiliimalia sp.]